jgi:hypothetical protein
MPKGQLAFKLGRKAEEAIKGAVAAWPRICAAEPPQPTERATGAAATAAA